MTITSQVTDIDNYPPVGYHGCGSYQASYFSKVFFSEKRNMSKGFPLFTLRVLHSVDLMLYLLLGILSF